MPSSAHDTHTVSDYHFEVADDVRADHSVDMKHLPKWDEPLYVVRPGLPRSFARSHALDLHLGRHLHLPLHLH